MQLRLKQFGLLRAILYTVYYIDHTILYRPYYILYSLSQLAMADSSAPHANRSAELKNVAKTHTEALETQDKAAAADDAFLVDVVLLDGPDADEWKDIAFMKKVREDMTRCEYDRREGVADDTMEAGFEARQEYRKRESTRSPSTPLRPAPKRQRPSAPSGASQETGDSGTEVDSSDLETLDYRSTNRSAMPRYHSAEDSDAAVSEDTPNIGRRDSSSDEMGSDTPATDVDWDKYSPVSDVVYTPPE